MRFLFVIKQSKDIWNKNFKLLIIYNLKTEYFAKSDSASEWVVV
jgi:hypothetical protein